MPYITVEHSRLTIRRWALLPRVVVDREEVVGYESNDKKLVLLRVDGGKQTVWYEGVERGRVEELRELLIGWSATDSHQSAETE